MKVIGITGKAGAGKDTFANYLFDSLQVNGGFIVTEQLAAPIKLAVACILDIDVGELEVRRFKEASLLDEYEIDTSPRQMMQTLGTEWGRDLDEDIWLKLLQRRLEQYEEQGVEYVIITDVRFANEQRWIEEMGGCVIEIHRPITPHVSAHVSEAGLSGDTAFFVSNVAGLDSLKRDACDIAEEIIGECAICAEFQEAMSSRTLNDASPAEWDAAWDAARDKTLPF